MALQLEMALPVYRPPDYFAVKLDSDDWTFRFYKYDGIKFTCCKPTPGDKVFEEDIARRVLKFNNIHKIKATRLGFITFASNKRYSVYQFEFHPLLNLKKRENEFYMLGSDSGFNYSAIKQKMLALGPWPSVDGTWSITEPKKETVIQNNLPPPYVCELLINDAVTKNEQCPIIYEPLTRDNAIVTSCFHVFSREAFTEWQKKSKECPKCRAICSATA